MFCNNKPLMIFFFYFQGVERVRKKLIYRRLLDLKMFFFMMVFHFGIGSNILFKSASLEITDKKQNKTKQKKYEI